MEAERALRELAALLPAWIGLAPLLVVPFSAGIVFVGARAAGLVASWPLRSLPADAHWTERARRSWPARVVAATSPLFLGLTLGVLAGVAFSGPLSLLGARGIGVLVGAAAYAGAWSEVGRAHARATGRTTPLRVRLRAQLFMALVLRPHLWVALFAAAFMPTSLEPGAFVLGALVLAASALIAKGENLRLARRLGLVVEAQERVQRVVRETAAAMGSAPRGVWQAPMTMANAFAFPRTGELLFSTEACEGLSDGELAAITAHELGHLAEPKSVIAMRSAGLFVVAALAFLPLVAGTGGLVGALVFVLALLIALLLLRRLARKMEERADALAKTHESESGTYARALERIHELNVVPIVTGNKRGTHPDMWDRMVSAGAEPAYPRPERPPRLARQLALLLVLIGPALGLTITRLSLEVWADPSYGYTDALAAVQISALYGSSADVLGEAGWREHAEGRLESAEVLFAAADALSPEHPYWATDHAIALATTGRCDEAREAMARAYARTDSEWPQDPTDAAAELEEICGSQLE